MPHITQKQAFEILANPKTPMNDAMKAFTRAYRTSNHMTASLTLAFATGQRIKATVSPNRPEENNDV